MIKNDEFWNKTTENKECKLKAILNKEKQNLKIGKTSIDWKKIENKKKVKYNI